MDNRKIDLTDEEWMSLIRRDENGQLPPCCANISELRSIIMAIASNCGEVSWEIPRLLRAYAAVRDGHDLTREDFPVLEKLMAQVDAMGSLTRADLPSPHEREPIERRAPMTREELLVAQNLAERLGALVHDHEEAQQDEPSFLVRQTPRKAILG